MLHLSLLQLPRSRKRWRQLSPYQAHQLIWKAFDGVPRGERPFLFSLDDRKLYHSLLVQSDRGPDWSFLNGDGQIRTKTFDPARHAAGARLRFFVRANPTVDRKGYRDGKTRRIAVGINPEQAFAQLGRPNEAPNTLVEKARWREQQLREWLERKGADGGFEIEEMAAGPIVPRTIGRDDRPARGRGPITIHEVELTGTLRVTDSAAFADTTARGIGRARSFGYGLLMVRPA